MCGFKFLLVFIGCALATGLSGFILHVLDADVLQKWLGGQVIGLTYDWPVELLAALTTVEYGAGTLLLYGVLRHRLLPHGLLLRAMLLSLLLLTIKGELLRQLLMNVLVVGWNAWGVLNSVIPWVIWSGMSLVAVCLYERWLVNPDPALVAGAGSNH